MAQQEVTIRATQLRFIALPPMTLFGSALTAVIAVTVLWPYLDHLWLLAWAAGMAVLFACRFAVTIIFRRIAHDDARVARWFWPLAASAAASGIFWGLFGASFYLIDDVEVRGLVILIVASMLASGTIFYAAELTAHASFVLGCALPIAAAAFWHGTPVSTLFGVITFMYVALILRSAHSFNSSVSRTIRLQLENAALIARLQHAKDAAEDANRTKSQFLANMSHELRTPLNAVIGYSEIMLEDAEAEGREEHVADLKRIHTAGRHLLSLVNDVLDLSKIEAGRMEVLAAPIDMKSFLDDVVATALPLVANKGNRLVIERSGDLEGIVGDVTKLRQILLNLLSNAAKFTEHGRITVTVSRERRGSGDWLVIAVRDTGIGISRDALAKLFTRFTQADAATAGKYGGSGLGLALSQRLCRLLGGEIMVESEPGRGSCFTMRVPAAIGAGTTPDARAVELGGRPGRDAFGAPTLSLS